MNATNTTWGFPSNTHLHLTANKEDVPTVTKMLVHKTLFFPYELFLLDFKGRQDLGYLLKGNLNTQLEVIAKLLHHPLYCSMINKQMYSQKP